MTISIEWIVTRLKVVNTPDLDNVAIQACFDVKGADGDLQGFTQSDVLLGDPDPSTFTPIDQVTKEQAVAWTRAALGGRVKEFEDRVIEQIERQRTARPQSVVLPWMTHTEADIAT